MAVKVDLGSWTTMKPILNFQKVAVGGDMIAMIELMRGVVTEWGFEGDPHTFEAYENLAPADYKSVVEEVGQAVGNLFRG